MKQIIFMSSLLLLICAVGCNSNDKQSSQPELTQHYTFDQVKAVAAKYGLQDWVKEDTHNGLMYMDESQLENYMSRHKQIFDQQRESQQVTDRLKQTGGMSYNDYLALIDQLPAYRRMLTRAFDGAENEAAYQADIKKMRDSGINFVYLDEKAVINFSTCGKPNCD